YETETAEGVIGAIVKDGVEVQTLNAGERGSLILNQTPFYGESGGQVGDVGEITATGFRAEVTDTRKKLGDLVVHDVMMVESAAVTTRLMGLDDARASGARALFGEKYGDEVRVVSMGEIDDGYDHERTYSIELCGGTHVHRTGDIGLLTIVGESGVAAGVRRIEAKTRDEARKRLEADSRAYGDLAALLRAPAGEATERLEALIEDRRKLERELADAKRKLAMGGGLMLDVSNAP